MDGSSDNEQDGTIDGRDEFDIDLNADQDADMDAGPENEDDNDDDEDDDQEQADSQGSHGPPRSQGPFRPTGNPEATMLDGRLTASQGASRPETMPAAAPTSHPHSAVQPASPSSTATQQPSVASSTSFELPSISPELLTAPVYDIVPTIAAPHSTSINAVTATPDLRWVFSGGADGYVRYSSTNSNAITFPI